MNRTDRLYALVEELRAVAPRMRSARWLAERFEVSVRTIERDLSALQQSGVPIWAQAGRAGGYTIDPSATLPPLRLSMDEAVAVTIGLEQLRGGPFGEAAVSALRKLRAVMPDEDVQRAAALTARVHLLESDSVGSRAHPVAFAQALRSTSVLRIRYRDKQGAETEREVEPLGHIGKGNDWYLVAWCRLREGVRAFRSDRVTFAEATGIRPPARSLRREDLDIPFGTLRRVSDPEQR